MQSIVLIVDDQLSNLRFYTSFLSEHYSLLAATSATEARETLQRKTPHVIVLDINMPEMNGLDFAHELREHPKYREIPIVFLTGDKSPQSVKTALEMEHTDYLLKPIKPVKLHKRIEHALQHSIAAVFAQRYRESMTLLSDFFSAPPHRIDIESLHNHALSLVELISDERWKLSHLLETLPQDYNEASHNLNVGILAIMLGRTQHFSQRQLVEIAVAGMLHDIGKIEIDPEILNKKGQLQWYEYSEVQSHSEHGMQLAKEMGIHSGAILLAIKHHHERMDGTGYPDGLSGNAIGQYAQMLAVSDVFDALSTDRTYRNRYSSFEAFKIMRQDYKEALNQKLVKSLISLLR